MVMAGTLLVINSLDETIILAQQQQHKLIRPSEIALIYPLFKFKPKYQSLLLHYQENRNKKEKIPKVMFNISKTQKLHLMQYFYSIVLFEQYTRFQVYLT